MLSMRPFVSFVVEPSDRDLLGQPRDSDGDVGVLLSGEEKYKNVSVQL